VDGTAFRLRPNETYLSVNWLEFFQTPSCGDQIAAVRRAFQEKGTNLGTKAKFAVLSVSEVVEEAIRKESRQLTFIHEPDDEPLDPSHSGIHGYSPEDDIIADLIANCVQPQLYSARSDEN
jgi:hypothetical protein